MKGKQDSTQSTNLGMSNIQIANQRNKLFPVQNA